MSELLAGYAERDITPPLGVEMTGYGYYLERRARSVLDPLKVRALAVQSGGRRLLLASCDLLSLSVPFSDALRERIAGMLHLERPAVFLACTHTHSGPACHPLHALGEVDAAYLAKIEELVPLAAAAAAADLQPASLSFSTPTGEPIGFNRRNGAFHPIDPVLKLAAFARARDRLLLLNYACHPVTLGCGTEVSADWPGALVRYAERGGARAVCFQGFCGDINPVTSINRGGPGTSEDLELYGGLLWARAMKADRNATVVENPAIAAAEARIRLPLSVPGEEQIEAERAAFAEEMAGRSATVRFIEEWAEEALRRRREVSRAPFVDNVPIQAAAVGPVRILALPGEVFCEYGLRLQSGGGPLFSFGCCGGNVGYLPTAAAYDTPGDYACYVAPRVYGLFPFERGIEDLLLTECAALLGRVAIESGRNALSPGAGTLGTG